MFFFAIETTYVTCGEAAGMPGRFQSEAAHQTHACPCRALAGAPPGPARGRYHSSCCRACKRPFSDMRIRPWYAVRTALHSPNLMPYP